MNFWNTTNSWVGNYIKVYNKEKILHDKRFPFYKKEKKIRFCFPFSRNLQGSLQLPKRMASLLGPLCALRRVLECVGILEHGPRKREGILEILLTASILPFCSFLLTPNLCFYNCNCNSKLTFLAEGKHQDEFKGKFQSSYNHFMNVMNPVADYFAAILFWWLEKNQNQIYSLVPAPV